MLRNVVTTLILGTLSLLTGAAVVDVGVSRADGKLTGDVHPNVWDVAGHMSPNPGGVGPLTRAFLLTNVVERAENS